MLALSSTSALVLLWAGDAVYRSAQAGKYLKHLNLEAGRELYRQCQEIWPYYDEVIKNRKFAVLHFIDQCCAEERSGQQIVIIGAGLDALGIEVTQRYPWVKVFELDRENMRMKSEIWKKIDGSQKGFLRFIEVDALNACDVCDRLTTEGWDALKPTVVVLEGISYYLPPASLAELVADLGPDRLIIEYLKSESDIDKERLDIPGKIFGLIADQCLLPTIERYCGPVIEKTFGMCIRERLGMVSLEEKRTGKNRFFSTETSGWIEVCLLENLTGDDTCRR